jgi:hypothetical protein
MWEAMQKDFFTVHSLVSLAFFTLVAGFILVNVFEDLANKFTLEQIE